jgi:hypothetical protein
VDSGVGEGSLSVGGVEVLDQGGEGVELGGGSVPEKYQLAIHFLSVYSSSISLPADKNLPGVRLQVESKHGLVVVHVDLDLESLVSSIPVARLFRDQPAPETRCVQHQSSF